MASDHSSTQSSSWRDLQLRHLTGYDPYATAEEGHYFDPEEAERVCGLFNHLQLIEGEHAGKPFHLEDWQRAIVGAMYGWKCRGTGLRRYREVFVYVPRKNGKMLDVTTPIPTPGGWSTMGELRAGDVVFDESGIECNVVAAHPISPNPDSFIVTFSNGEQVKACSEHLWLTTAKVDKPGDKSSGRAKRPLTRVRTTQEIYDTQYYGKRQDRNHSMPMPDALHLPDADLPIDPYWLGCWLGDGTSLSSEMTCGEEDVEHYVSEFGDCGLHAQVTRHNNRAPTLLVRRPGIGKSDARNLQRHMRSMGLIGNKHIPAAYLRGSYSQRLALLQGLMDTDGTADRHGRACSFTSTRKAITDGIEELLASLGVKYRTRSRDSKINGRVVGIQYDTQFLMYRDEMPVFRLDRKLECQPLSTSRKTAGRSRTVQIVSVEPCDPVPMRCITVDSQSHLYRFGKTMLPTHNTMIAAGLVLVALFLDDEPGAQVYSAAADRDQAALVYRQAAGMIARNDELGDLCKLYRSFKSIELPGTNSVYKALSSEADTKHGLGAHMVIVDELHAHPNSELVDVLQTSMGSRTNPLMVHITTADYDKPSVCNQKHEYACKVRDGIFADASFLPVVYEASEADDWTDPKVWAKANPNIGVSVREEYLQRECTRAKNEPSYENTFKRLHLNIKTQQDVRWLPMGKWDACDDAPKPTGPCYAGLDLASTTDIAALVLYWPETHSLVPWFWIPADNAEKREKRDRVPYQTWGREGMVTLTPGNVIDYNYIRQQINDLASTYEIERIGYDPWNARHLAQQLQDEDGLPMSEFRQGYVSMNEPSKQFERLLVSEQLRHGGNPVLRWMASNATAKLDPSGNIKPDKAKSTEKIDGIVASIMAVGLGMNPEADTSTITESPLREW